MKQFFVKVLSLSLAIALLGMAVVAPASAESLASLAANASTAEQLESPFKTVYQEVSQSIVGIKLSMQFRISNGRIVNNEASFVGSGVVISADGYVVTNYHVVTANSSITPESIIVTYGGEEYNAEYVAGDEETDVAVLKVEGLTAPAAKLGNSDALTVGDWALVVGNPIDEEFANTLTVGVISGLNRNMSSVSSSNSINSSPMIQTSAQINSGNSGGGLFNINGELVGITSAKLSTSGFSGMASIEGIGLAIPINTVIRIADDLITHGSVQYPRLGISIRDVNSTEDEPTEDTLPAGAFVDKVESGSPAEAAGIQRNDIIVEADGQRIRKGSELQTILRAKEIGTTISIKIYRIENFTSLKPDDPVNEGEYLTFDVEVKVID